MKILLSPHNDDECCFSSFTVQREKPLVIVVFDSFIQVTRGAPYCDWETRRAETILGLCKLLHDSETGDCPDGKCYLRETVRFCAFRDDAPVPPWMIADKIEELIEPPCLSYEPSGIPIEIWAPATEQNGHEQHNEVSRAALYLKDRWPGVGIHWYLTYTRHNGKSRSGMPVPATPEMIRRKHLALACYKSQIENPMTREWFMRDLEEYYA